VGLSAAIVAQMALSALVLGVGAAGFAHVPAECVEPL
jgi:hypothetical protein